VTFGAVVVFGTVFTVGCGLTDLAGVGLATRAGAPSTVP
jgi:hypothetical protein